MIPQVRETEQTPIAVPGTTPNAPLADALYIAKPVIEIKSPASEDALIEGPSMLVKRHRRRARLSARH